MLMLELREYSWSQNSVLDCNTLAPKSVAIGLAVLDVKNELNVRSALRHCLMLTQT
jgi:hypothetical protein